MKKRSFTEDASLAHLALFFSLISSLSIYLIVYSYFLFFSSCTSELHNLLDLVFILSFCSKLFEQTVANFLCRLQLLQVSLPKQKIKHREKYEEAIFTIWVNFGNEARVFV